MLILEIIKDESKIDCYKFWWAWKFYVDRINVYGNYITDEKVIRNSLIVDEGDPFNDILFDKSIKDTVQKIFSKVDYEVENNSLNKVIDILGGKTNRWNICWCRNCTTGSSLSAGIKENNYLVLELN